MRHLMMDGALAALVLGALISVSALLERQAVALTASLARHGLDQVLLGEVQLRNPGGSPPPGGLAEDRLLSPSSWQRLRQHPAVEQAEAIERLPGMQVQAQGASRGLDLDVLVIPPRLLAQWQGGSTRATEALGSGHLVMDAAKLPDGLAPSGGRARLDLQPAFKAVLSPEAPPMLLPLHHERLELPQGTSFLQAAAYLRQDHPELKRSGLFSPPWLWVRLRPGHDRHAFLAWANAELAKPGGLALQGATLTLQPMAGHQAVNPETLRRWQAWSQAGITLAAWLLLGGLAMWRWPELKREVALRRSVGQPTGQACRRAVHGQMLALGAGALAGWLLGAGATGADLTGAPAWQSATWGLSALLVGAALLVIPCWRVARDLPAWRVSLGMGT